MLNYYLFEIEYAEKEGNYRLADRLDKALVRIASKSSDIKKKLKRKFKQEDGVRDIAFSAANDKFIIQVEHSVPYRTKKKIKEMADPYKVSFRYSAKQSPLEGESEDPMDRMIADLLEEFPGEDPIAWSDLEGDEPTEEDLRYTAEFPDEAEFDDVSVKPYNEDEYRRKWLN